MTAAATHTATYTVAGMTCQHCVMSVTEELSDLAGVTNVRVELDTGAVTVTSDRPLGPAEVVTAITDAGYRLAD